MTRRLSLILLLLLAMPLCASAQKLYAFHQDSVKTGYPFLLCLPEGYDAERLAQTDTLERPPMIIFLHGRSRTGRDLSMVTRYGCIDALRRGQDIPALIVSPQTPVTSWDAAKVMAVVDWIGERYPYDTDRLYVIGMSMGGWGAFKVAANYPDRIAAAIAECGGYTDGNEKGLTQLPLWIIHGTADRITKPSFSHSVVDRMTALPDGAKHLKTTWLEGCDHSILARTFLLKQMYDWLFSHHLSDPGRSVNRDIDIEPRDLNAAYTRLNPQKARALPIQKPE